MVHSLGTAAGAEHTRGECDAGSVLAVLHHAAAAGARAGRAEQCARRGGHAVRA